MRNVRLSILTMAVCLLLSRVAIFSMDGAARRADRAVVDRLDFIDCLKNLLTTAQTAEIGQRDYLLTSDRRGLDAYLESRSKVSQSLTAVRDSAQTNGLSPATSQQLGWLIDGKLEELRNTTELHDKRGQDAAVSVLRFGNGWNLTDGVRSLIDQEVATQNVEIDGLRSDRNTINRRRLTIGSVLAALNLSIFILIVRGIRRGTATIERKAADARHKELFGITLSSIGDGVIVTDTAAKIVFLNRVAEELTGWTLAEAEGLPCGDIFNIVNEQTRLTVDSPVDRVLRYGATVALANHTVLIRRDGTELPIDDSGAPIRHADGVLHGVVLVFRDFSARLAAEREMQRLNAELAEKVAEMETIFTEAPIGIAVASDSRCRTVTMNPFLAHLLEMPVDPSAGPLQRFSQPAAKYTVRRDGREIPVEERPLQIAAATGKSVHDMEIEIAFAGGRTISVFGSAVPLFGPDGEPRGALGSFADRTEWKRAEALLRQSKEEAQAANAAKDNFLATLSHELRTPLTPVATLLASWERDPGLPAPMLPDVQMMRRNVELEARMIDDLLDLTRIVQNKVALNPETTDVHELLNAVIDIYKTEMDAKRLTLTRRLDADCHHVNADPARFQQVLWNLLRNAAKFTPAGGAIDVHTTTDSDGNLVIDVSDNGIGMSAETLTKLFRPFEQGTAETVRRYGGLGLGLALSKALLESQGGVITATSKGLNSGSTFTVWMPCVDAPQYKPDPALMPWVSSEQSHALRLLLVEDHADTARVMARLLQGRGHDVTVADSVAVAIASLDGSRFDMLLSDIGLPDGSGLDVIRHLRQASDIPAIVISGYGMEHDIAKCRAAGFDAHITKPLNFQRLETLIAELSARDETPLAKVA